MVVDVGAADILERQRAETIQCAVTRQRARFEFFEDS
jgi:hypothetical protein